MLDMAERLLATLQLPKETKIFKFGIYPILMEIKKIHVKIQTQI